jgi:formyl-CoA transferase
MDFQASRWLIAGEVAGQAGNDHPTGFPTGVFETADGLVNLSAVSDQNFRDFLGQIGLPELSEDERFLSAKLRLANKDALREACEPALRKLPSEVVIDRLNSVGVPCGPILSVDQVFQHPQVEHLQVAQRVVSNRFGDLSLVRSPFSFSRTPSAVHSASPASGEHTTEILKENGWSDEEISKLIEDRVVQQA